LTEFGIHQRVPNRDIGIAMHGNIVDGLEYYLGRSTARRRRQNYSRLGTIKAPPRGSLRRIRQERQRRVKGLGFGLREHMATRRNAANYRTVGKQTFFAGGGTANDGTTWRAVPQLYQLLGPFGLLAEYAISHTRTQNARPRIPLKTRWQVSASWV